MPPNLYDLFQPLYKITGHCLLKYFFVLFFPSSYPNFTYLKQLHIISQSQMLVYLIYFSPNVSLENFCSLLFKFTDLYHSVSSILLSISNKFILNWIFHSRIFYFVVFPIVYTFSLNQLTYLWVITWKLQHLDHLFFSFVDLDLCVPTL